MDKFAQEVWRPIQNHPTFEVSTLGKVRKRAHVIIYDKITVLHVPAVPVQISTDPYGYKCVNIEGRHYKLHRLVAAAFIEKTNDTQTRVIHKDQNVSNNCADNLEWISTQKLYHDVRQHYKNRYYTAAGRRVRCLQTGDVFVSIKAAATYYHLPYNPLRVSIQRGRVFKGYTFERTSDLPTILKTSDTST